MDVGSVELIENALSDLIVSTNEETYNKFLNSNPLLKIYDNVLMLEDNDNILTDEFLNKVLNLVNEELKKHA